MPSPVLNQSYYCEKCGKVLDGKEFYLSNNTEKYGKNDGRLNQCKKCLTMHVDNWDPNTYLWILQEIDVPYVPEEWNKLLANYGRDPSRMTGLTIIGRYLSKMKLKQFRDYRWKDNEFLRDLANKKIKETMERSGYEAAEITEAIEKATFTVPEGDVKPPENIYEDATMIAPGASGSPTAHSLMANDDEDIKIEMGLTEEDRTYLRLKWGKSYKPSEWVQLEQLYNEMTESFDIQTASHIDTLKLVCKTSLKANQLIDLNDIDGYQKMSKVYDQLMRAGKFTAQQNKEEQGEYVDSISELVAICESDGFIPRYYTEGPQDKVDKIILDLQDYTKTLITEEMHLGALIEKAVKQIEEDRLKEKEEEIDGETDEEALEREMFSETSRETTDEDFMKFREWEEEVAKENEEYFKMLGEEE